MLGQEEPPPEPTQKDALGEIVNVICGNLLPSIAGPEPVFDISAPEILEKNAATQPAEQSPSALASVGLDVGWVGLALILEDSYQEIGVP